MPKLCPNITFPNQQDFLQLVNQWLNFAYSHSHAFRYERKNTNPTLVRIELTTSSALAGVQVTYTRPLERQDTVDILVCRTRVSVLILHQSVPYVIECKLLVLNGHHVKETIA